MAQASTDRHRSIREMRPAMVKADLPSGEAVTNPAQIGACLDEARRVAGWNVDQLAAELKRDSKQVARWMRGEERTQVDVVLSVPALRKPFVIALAKLTGEFEITTTLRVAA
jgi:ribosome-binding protein aMBF1 (putative translation factor)